jgi:ribonuclease P protein component
MGKTFDNQKKPIRYTFKKEERLCSKKLFDQLFSDGISFLVYPLRVVYLVTGRRGDYPAQAAFAVSKRLFKKAVKRNLVKRRMRESYRYYKHLLDELPEGKMVAIVMIYVGKEILDYQKIKMATRKSLKRILLQEKNKPL